MFNVTTAAATSLIPIITRINVHQEYKNEECNT